MLAAAAKERLAKGYWSDIKQERSDAIQCAKGNGRDPSVVVKYYAEKCSRDIAAMSNEIDRREEEMYAKVKYALDRNVEILNPVSLLVDTEYMRELTDAERQRYMFSLMGKYSALKERYLREKRIIESFRA